MASSPHPCSHTLSVRLGAPTAWLPLPSMPWQAAQAANFGRPRLAAMLSCALPDRLSTYCATLCTSCALPTAAAIGGIVPTRPLAIVSSIFCGVPPCSQSLSVRSGKPLLPRASEPWHIAQLLTNSRSPTPMACPSLASCSAGKAARRAYKGAVASAASRSSAACCAVLLHLSDPSALPRPG